MFVASEAFGTMGMMNNTDAELTDPKELIDAGVRRGAILLYMPTSYLSLQWIMKIPHCYVQAVCAKSNCQMLAYVPNATITSV